MIILPDENVTNRYFQFLGSKAHFVSEFVKITKIRNKDAGKNLAEKLFDQISFDLERAVAWFYEHKNDDKYKEHLKTEDESKEEEQGTILVVVRRHYGVNCI